jgi:hypothetical protein
MPLKRSLTQREHWSQAFVAKHRYRSVYTVDAGAMLHCEQFELI